MGRRKRKLIQEPLELAIEDLSHDGRGIARYNGKVMFVSGALPGEDVVAKHTGGNKNFEEAVVTEVLKSSADRVEPDCEFFKVCNGCTMMHLAPVKQIEFKQNTLKQNLMKMAQVEPKTWLKPLLDEPWNYRRRARLSVRWVIAKERVLVGFREKNGRYVADMQSCKVLKEPLGQMLESLAELIAELDIKQHVAQIEASVADNDVALIFRHLKPINLHDKNLLLEFAKRQGVRIFSQSKGPKTILELTKSKQPLYFDFFNDSIRMEFLPSDFIQVNSAMNKKMIDRALTMLDVQDSDVVLDLFCGLGNFTLPLAKRASKVVGVEGEKTLVQRAQHNASINQIDNAEFHTADLTQNQDQAQWFKQDYNKVLIDPPRSGAWDILPLIAKTSAQTLLYVSCHPASLARDSQRLVHELGFELIEAGVMDMFPHTSHVESIALFKR